MGRRLPRVSVTHATTRDGEKIINLGSEVGGCLVSVKIVDGRLRIEVYRADDTVDVIAPSRASTSRDVSHLCRPRDVDDQRMLDGGMRRDDFPTT